MLCSRREFLRPSWKTHTIKQNRVKRGTTRADRGLRKGNPEASFSEREEGGGNPSTVDLEGRERCSSPRGEKLIEGKLVVAVIANLLYAERNSEAEIKKKLNRKKSQEEAADDQGKQKKT